MKILFLLFVLFLIGCQNNSIPQQKTSYAEQISSAKSIIYKDDSDVVELQKALELLRSVPSDSKEYLVARELINMIEDKKYGKKAVARIVPVIGMRLTELTAICGRPDDVSSYETASAKIVSYDYEYSKLRADQECWGRFTFDDYVLESISR